MKISKSLLSAILIGIAVQTSTSCKKDSTPPAKEASKESKEKENKPVYEPGNCPACGLG